MVKSCLIQNGVRQVGELGNTKISALDSSFLFGDGIYEVIAVANGRMYDLAPHLERLGRSLAIVGIPAPMTMQKIAAELEEVLKINNATNGYVYLQISRDSHSVRDFLIHPENKPSFFAYYADQKIFPQQTANEGETSLIFPDIRWSLKHVKTTQLMASRIAKDVAAKNGAVEPIYISKDGIITEGGSTNIFIVNGKEILTHPAESDILWGITRARIIGLAKSEGFKVSECKFNLDAMLSAEEVFRTASTQGVRGIGQVKIIKNTVEAENIWQPEGFNIGTHKIGNGFAGEITRRLSAKYAETALKGNKNETAELAQA